MNTGSDFGTKPGPKPFMVKPRYDRFMLAAYSKSLKPWDEVTIRVPQNKESGGTDGVKTVKAIILAVYPHLCQVAYQAVVMKCGRPTRVMRSESFTNKELMIWNLR